MKSGLRSKTHPNWLHRLIQEATNAPVNDFKQIENIMRDEIFHSTLDWQTREQLSDGARRAFLLLRGNRELYESGLAGAQSLFRKMHAEPQAK